MKVYFVDYIGIRSGMMYYIDAFDKIVKEISNLETSVISNYQPKGTNKKPVLLNHYKGNILKKGFSLLINCWRFKQFIKSHPNDIYIYDAFGNSIDIVFLKLLSKAKFHIVDVHEAIAQHLEGKTKIYNRLKKVYKNQIKAAISHSERTTTFLKDFEYDERLLEVPHFKYQIDKAFDINKVSEDIKNAYEKSKLNLLMFGTITKEKGADLLIEALNSIPPTILKEINVVIAGRDFDGSCRQIEPNEDVPIKFILKYINDDEMVFLYDNCDMILMPYRKTSQSGVLEMAFYFKKPIIASKIPYFEKTLNLFPSFGVLCPSSKFADAIIKAYEQNNLNYFKDEEYDRYTNRKEIIEFKENFKSLLKSWIDLSTKQ